MLYFSSDQDRQNSHASDISSRNAIVEICQVHTWSKILYPHCRMFEVLSAQELPFIGVVLKQG